MYKLTDIRHETHDFWVLDTHTKGFEVYRKGCTVLPRRDRIL